MVDQSEPAIVTDRVSTRPLCARCQRYITIDTDADRDLWAEVFGDRFGPGYICGDCFTRAADERLIDWVGRVRFIGYSLAAERRASLTTPDAGKEHCKPIGGDVADVLRWCDHVERFAYERLPGGLDASPHLLAAAARKLAALAPDATQTREAEAERVLAAFNGGMVRVPDEANPRGFTTYYRPLDAMRAALAGSAGQ